MSSSETNKNSCLQIFMTHLQNTYLHYMLKTKIRLLTESNVKTEQGKKQNVNNKQG